MSKKLRIWAKKKDAHSSSIISNNISNAYWYIYQPDGRLFSFYSAVVHPSESNDWLLRKTKCFMCLLFFSSFLLFSSVSISFLWESRMFYWCKFTFWPDFFLSFLRNPFCIGELYQRFYCYFVTFVQWNVNKCDRETNVNTHAHRKLCVCAYVFDSLHSECRERSVNR